MGMLLTLFPAAALAILFHKKIEETVAPAAMSLLLIIYLPGLWMKLSIGLYLSLFIIGISAIFCAFILFKDRIRLRNSVITWGMAAFLIYAIFFAYYSLHRNFSHPDELYCWGLMAKNYYHYDELFSPLSTALSADQTPLVPILGYFSSRTWMEFSDSIVYYGQNLFTISLLLPVFAHVRSRINAPKFLTLIVMLPSLLVLSGLEAFWYILGDMVLASMMCLFILNVLKFSGTGDFYYYAVALVTIASICLTKRLGAVIAAFVIFIAVPVLIKTSVAYIRELAGLMIVSSLVIFSWFGSSIYDIVTVVALIGGVVLCWMLNRISFISGRYRELIRVGLVLLVMAVVFGFMIVVLGRDPFGYAVMARFARDIFRITTEDGYVCLSYGIYVCVAFLMSMVFRYVRQNRIHVFKADSAGIYEIVFCWTGIAMIIYALFMLFMHIWQIGPMNDYMESLIPRYMIPWEIMVVFLVIFAVISERDDIALLPLLAGMLILICISDTGELYRQMFAKHQCVGYYALSDAGIELMPDDLIYFIDEDNSFGYSDREFYYRSWPARTNFIDQIFMGNSGRVEFTAMELEQMMISDQYLKVPYDYLYLQTIDDDFAERYSVLFEDPSDIASGSAYYVLVDGDHVRLRSVKSENKENAD